MARNKTPKVPVPGHGRALAELPAQRGSRSARQAPQGQGEHQPPRDCGRAEGRIMSKDKLNDVTGAEAEALVWDAIAEHLRKAVLYALPRYAGHTPGGSVSQKDAWRQAKPEALAEQIVTFAMAGIHPV